MNPGETNYLDSSALSTDQHNVDHTRDRGGTSVLSLFDVSVAIANTDHGIFLDWL